MLDSFQALGLCEDAMHFDVEVCENKRNQYVFFEKENEEEESERGKGGLY